MALFSSIPPRVLCRRLAVAVLGSGLASAVAVYLTAGAADPRLLGYEGLGGSPYPVLPEDSRMYLRGMEMYGGKANLLAWQFREWFAGLWQGRELAVTLAVLSLGLALFLYFVSTRFPADGPPPGDS